MKKYSILIILVLSSFACSFLTRKVTPTMIPPTAVIPPTLVMTTVTPVATSTASPRMIETGMYCPSEIQQATDIYNQGYDQENAGNYEKAVEFYRQAIELDPEYCDAMDNLALNLKRIGKTEESLDWYLRSIEIFPTNDVAYLGLGNAYRQLEKYEEAISTYEKFKEIAPGNPEAYFGLGMTYYATKQYQDSIDNFKEAERLYKEQDSPYAADAQMFIGYDYYAFNDMENAAQYLELAYPSYQDDATLNYYLGLVYYNKSSIQDLEKAKQYLSNARDLGYKLESDLETFVNQP